MLRDVVGVKYENKCESFTRFTDCLRQRLESSVQPVRLPGRHRSENSDSYEALTSNLKSPGLRVVYGCLRLQSGKGADFMTHWKFEQSAHIHQDLPTPIRLRHACHAAVQDHSARSRVEYSPVKMQGIYMKLLYKNVTQLNTTCLRLRRPH